MSLFRPNSVASIFGSRGSAVLNLVKPIFRLAYRSSRWTNGLLSRTERRLTKPGIAVGIGVLIAGMMSADTENNVAYQAFSILLSILVISGLFSFVLRTNFNVVRRLPRFGTVGCPLVYSVVVQNTSAKSQAGLTLRDEPDNPSPGFEEWLEARREADRRVNSFRVSSRLSFDPFRPVKIAETSIAPISAGQESQVLLEFIPNRRGLFRFKGATIGRLDPLGLTKALRFVALPQSVLILPKRYRLPSVPLRGGMKYQPGGVALASSVGQSHEYMALRDYRPGDPLRHIHWRSWAKVGKPVVKEFEDEFFVRHALVLDTFTESEHSELFEEAVSVAASFACTVQTQESLLDLLLVGNSSYYFSSGRSLGYADQMLEILASAQTCVGRPFSSLEHLVLEHVRVMSGCIFVLMAWDEPRRRLVSKIRALGLPVIAMVITDSGMGGKDRNGTGVQAAEPVHWLELGRIEAGLAQLSA